MKQSHTVTRDMVRAIKLRILQLLGREEARIALVAAVALASISVLGPKGKEWDPGF